MAGVTVDDTSEWSYVAQQLLKLVDELPDVLAQLSEASKRFADVRLRASALYVLMSEAELARLEPLVAEKLSKLEKL